MVPEEGADAWLWLVDDGSIVCPLAYQDGVLLAVTLYCRGGLSDEARRRRNLSKAKRRAGKRAAQDAQRGRDGIRVVPDAEEWA
jgi:hypothetical protein